MSNRAFAKGYDDYYEGVEASENYYDFTDERSEWDAWRAGHMFAYIEDEGK